jgi:hypothetical protein
MNASCAWTRPLQAFHLTYDPYPGQVWLGFEDLTGYLEWGLDEINPVTDTVTTIKSNHECSPRTVFACDFSGLYAVNGNTCPAQVQLVNTASVAVSGTFPLTGGDPVAAAASENGGNLYVAYGTNAVSAYSKSSGDLDGSVSISQPSLLSIYKPSGAVFVTPGSAAGRPAITVLNAAGTTVMGTIPVSGPGWIAADNTPSTTRSMVYVANGNSGATVFAISPSAPAITSADHATFTAGKPGTFRVGGQGTPASSLSMRDAFRRRQGCLRDRPYRHGQRHRTCRHAAVHADRRHAARDFLREPRHVQGREARRVHRARQRVPGRRGDRARRAADGPEVHRRQERYGGHRRYARLGDAR